MPKNVRLNAIEQNAQSLSDRRRSGSWRLRGITKLQRRFIFRLLFILLIVASALAAPLLAPVDPTEQNIAERIQPAGTRMADGTMAWFGTDQLGRDILSRILYGGRVSLLISLSSVALAAVIGVTLGLTSGFYGGYLDSAIMRLVDVWLGFPGLLFAITLAAALGPSVGNVIIALGVSSWTVYARVVRSQVLSIARLEYVVGAHVIGCTKSRILMRYILPNTMASIIIIGTLHLGAMILAESGLSFIGLGVQPPTASWGSMINQGREYITSAWWLITFPGFAITLTVIATGMLGDSIRDLMDPHMRTGGLS